MRIAAGILMIIGGLGLGSVVSEARYVAQVYEPWLVLAYAPMIVAYIGAYNAFRGRSYEWSVGGAISSVFYIPLVGILAVVFVVIARDQFSSRRRQL